MEYVSTTSDEVVVADASLDQRVRFLQRTYLHVGLAVGVFAVLCAVFVQAFGERSLQLLGKSQFSWLLVLGAFMLICKVAEGMARSSASLPTQYAGLGLFVVAEALIFTPMLTIASTFYPGVLTTAAILTGAVFGGLTLYTLTSKRDFGFMGRYIAIAGFAAMGLIAASFFLPFNLGMLFSAAMIALAAASIVYQTSNIARHYPPTAHVAASLALFGSLATMFFYVVRLLMRLQSSD